MAKRMLIDALHPEETRVAIADENQIYDFDFVSTAKKQLKGNIYLAKITRVEPSLQAAFVEYGGGKQGFLPFAEIHADYYQIPVSDRKRLMEDAARENAEEDVAAEPEQAQTSTETTQIETEPSTDLPNDLQNENVDVIAPSDSTYLELGETPAYLMQAAPVDTGISEEVAPLEESHVADMPFIEPPTELITDEAPTEVEPFEQSLEAGNAENAASEEVETLESDESSYQERPKKTIFSKRYKIQEVIRRGQIVLVQVIKEERGNKGCSLTTYLSLAGRYCVLMPNSPKDGGISRKIASAEDRKRLKAISTEMRLAEGMSVIIRTAGMDRTRAEIKRDYDYLVKVWNGIREETLKSTAPALIYEESDIIKRAIRDQYANDIDELIVEGDAGYKSAREFMKLLLPSHTPKIKHYQDATPLFYAYGIEEQLLSMHDPIVKLKSGGYIVINPTEALISIDVNSGRATGERNIEETASKTNLEAAAEVARQLRLRDLAGLIVIDFIDMLESRNRRAVEKAIKDALKADRAKIQLGRISPFGLLEMSRQRLRPSISETNMMQCPHCTGRGVIRSGESMSIQMIRAIEKEASSGNWSGLRVLAPQSVALHLLNHKREALQAIEERYGISVQILIGADLTASEFNIEKMRRGGSDRSERSERPERNNDRDRDRNRHRPERDRPRAAPAMEAAPEEDTRSDFAGNDNEAPREGMPSAGENPRRGNRRGGRGRRGGRDRNDRGPRPVLASDQGAITPEAAESVEEQSEMPLSAEGENTPSIGNRPPRTRGGRGRRRWKDRGDRPPREGGETHMNEDIPMSYSSGAAAEVHSYAPTLPAYTLEAPVLMEPKITKPYFHKPVEVAPTSIENTPRDPNAPPKKGWWKKMIELD